MPTALPDINRSLLCAVRSRLFITRSSSFSTKSSVLSVKQCSFLRVKQTSLFVQNAPGMSFPSALIRPCMVSQPACISSSCGINENVPFFRVSSSVIKTVSIRETFKYPAIFIQNQPFLELKTARDIAESSFFWWNLLMLILNLPMLSSRLELSSSALEASQAPAVQCSAVIEVKKIWS